jgi:sporulation protein YlmC with PRC-barrel domain
MNRRHAKFAWASGLLAGALAIATGGMAMAPPDGPLRMSNLRISGLAGFDVVDSNGGHVGEVISVDTDRRGHARWLTIALEQGGEVRLASFRAWLDAGERQIALQLPEDIVLRRAEADALNSLSAGI